MRHLSNDIIPIQLPASKSICNRVLILQYLSGTDFSIYPISNANDTVLLQKILNEIKNKNGGVINCKDAGTVFRFLTSVLSIVPGEWILTGTERMQERPIGSLVNSLNTLGTDITYLHHEGYPPLKIIGREISGAEINFSSVKSSQFISSLMMIAPFIENGMKIQADFENTGSLPYVFMTAKIMQYFGLTINYNKSYIEIPNSEFIPKDFIVERDWSAASYLYSIVALCPHIKLNLPELFEDSFQGDSILYKWFEELGVKTKFADQNIFISNNNRKTNHFSKDFKNYPDLAPAFAVCCAALKIPAVLSGLSSLRIKESDRLKALYTELSKMNVSVIIEDDTLKILPSSLQISEPVDTYNDHRIAMAFAPLQLIYRDLIINHKEVVKKSFPDFWSEFNKISSYITS